MSASSSSGSRGGLIEGSFSVDGEKKWVYSQSSAEPTTKHEGVLGNLLRDIEIIRKQSNNEMTQLLKSQQPGGGDVEVGGGDENELSDDSGDEGSSKKTPKKQKKNSA
eukprot:TRINITY_DN6640_c0_g1_i1.p1 TRINITY_DN6640_c0_g1~~TRINITY_DN6640_c0_g1_i1.p1  ORF type:complete len:108 (+),score=32.73 TRINITY_DN6640_c0_g1_i1:108-431(+)